MSYEPKWLRNLRTSVNAGRMSKLRTVPVNVADLEQAVGACGDGPGGDALIGASAEGTVAVDFQKLLKAVYFTPDEADAFAETMKKHAASIRARGVTGAH